MMQAIFRGKLHSTVLIPEINGPVREVQNAFIARLHWKRLHKPAAPRKPYRHIHTGRNGYLRNDCILSGILGDKDALNGWLNLRRLRWPIKADDDARDQRSYFAESGFNRFGNRAIFAPGEFCIELKIRNLRVIQSLLLRQFVQTVARLIEF